MILPLAVPLYAALLWHPIPPHASREHPMHTMSAADEGGFSGTGFVGTGTIAAAICTGLAATDTIGSTFHVSRRSTSKSVALAAAFSSVTVEDDNQAILDACELVFLCVRPEHVEETLASLRRAAQSL